MTAAYSDGGEAAFDRSNAAYERAKTLDPDLISAALNLSNNRVERGEVQKGYTEAAELVKRRPENGLAHFSLAYVLRYAGLLKEAQRECDIALALDPGNYLFRSCAVVFYRDGNYRRAMEYIALDSMDSSYSKRAEVQMLTAQTFPVSDPERRYTTAEFEALCGRHKAALGVLREVVESGYCSYPAIDFDPLFAALRGTAEFQEVRSAGIDCQKKFLAYRNQHPL